MSQKISIFDSGLKAKTTDEIYSILNQVYQEIKQEYQKYDILSVAMTMAGLTTLERMEYLRLCGWRAIWLNESWYWIGSPLSANDIRYIKQLTSKDVNPANIHLRSNINLIPNYILIPAGKYALQDAITKGDQDFWIKNKDCEE